MTFDYTFWTILSLLGTIHIFSGLSGLLVVFCIYSSLHTLNRNKYILCVFIFSFLLSYSHCMGDSLCQFQRALHCTLVRSPHQLPKTMWLVEQSAPIWYYTYCLFRVLQRNISVPVPNTHIDRLSLRNWLV
jgi:hypothetical protein